MLPENQVTQDILPAKPELLGRAKAYLWASLWPPPPQLGGTQGGASSTQRVWWEQGGVGERQA